MDVEKRLFIVRKRHFNVPKRLFVVQKRDVSVRKRDFNVPKRLSIIATTSMDVSKRLFNMTKRDASVRKRLSNVGVDVAERSENEMRRRLGRVKRSGRALADRLRRALTLSPDVGCQSVDFTNAGGAPCSFRYSRKA